MGDFFLGCILFCFFTPLLQLSHIFMFFSLYKIINCTNYYHEVSSRLLLKVYLVILGHLTSMNEFIVFKGWVFDCGFLESLEIAGK